MRIDEEEIAKIRSNADIVDVIGHYLQIHKSGKNYKALCPFHDDHSPSMNISEDMQIYKCFVCGAGGNVFSFVQNYEKISFQESVARVASLTGQKLSFSVDQLESKPKNQHAEKLYKILNETIHYTMYQLNTEAAEKHKQYLDRRGLDENILERFQIGYNPSKDVLYTFLHAKGYDDEDMNACNVIRTSASGIHDVFSDRITFPIHDAYGNPIGFSARTIDPENPSKYINTTETELYTKGNTVYNAHRAGLASRQKGQVYVCEGVTDVIAFYRAGIENCVCTLGTACTANQIKVLKSLAKKIVFCYDGDEPGQAATMKAAKMAKEAGAEVSIIVNKTGRDPDEIIRQSGREALQDMASKEESWIEFVIDYYQKKTNFSSYLEKKEFVTKVQTEIDALTDDFDRRHFTEELSRISGFRLEYQPKNTQVRMSSVSSVKAPDGNEEAEKLILTLMIHNAEAARHFQEKIGFLTDPTRQSLAMMIVDAYRKNETADPAMLMDSTENSKIKEMIASLCSDWKKDIAYSDKLMDGAIRKVKITMLSAKADAFKQQLQQNLDAKSRELVLNEYQECLIELRRYIDEEDREN